MAINEDLSYEINDKGERVLVKSIESRQRVFLRFRNQTSRPVDVWWRDFLGIKRQYVRLQAGGSFDVNTFLTHPWEFSDSATKESFVINNKTIFRAPFHVDGAMMYRTNWNITVPMRSLRSTAMLSLATLLPTPEAAFQIDLPIFLSRELSELVTIIQTAPALPPNV